MRRVLLRTISSLLVYLLLFTSVCSAVGNSHTPHNHIHNFDEGHSHTQSSVNCCEDTEHKYTERAIIHSDDSNDSTKDNESPKDYAYLNVRNHQSLISISSFLARHTKSIPPDISIKLTTVRRE